MTDMDMSFRQLEKLLKLKEKYEKIILKHLDIRDNCDDPTLLEPSEYRYKPVFVVNMMKELDEVIPGDNNFDKINSMETFAMGHTDYMSKFALYCAEIHIENLKNNNNAS
jgi:hypothetical protein